MFSHKTRIRVRYAETDQMGVVYYGNYPQYFEVARVEALRSLGVSYRQIEEAGVMLPVRKLEVRYKGGALYDEELTLVTDIFEMPNTRINFSHKIYNSKEVLITTGNVELVFVDKTSKKPCACPSYLEKLFIPYFSS
jgi:acyl-CoA thioester hydrolase